MTPGNSWRRNVPRLLAVIVVAVAYFGGRIPARSMASHQELASRFHFTPMPLVELPGSPGHTIRPVHPALARIQSWVSSLGASAALADFDANGRPDDLCTVDPRSDRIVIEPVPGTGSRYEPFAIHQPDGPSFVIPTGCLPGDLNEDGLLDLLVIYWGRPPIAYLRLTGEPQLTATSFVPIDVGPAGEIWNTNTATLADLDGDGHLDIVVGNYFPDGVRLLDPMATGAAPMQHSMSRAYNGGRNRLLLWDGATSGRQPAVRFRDASTALPDDALTGWTHAVGAADLDGDGRAELMFINDFGPDRLFHNESTPGHLSLREAVGRRTWTTPASKVLGRDSFKGMGVDFGDLNGDLVPDIYVSNIAVAGVAVESHFLFMSEGPITDLQAGIAPYVDRSEPRGLSRSGWAWDCKLADFNDDGVLEAVQATGFIKGTVNRWPEVQELTLANDELLPWTKLWPRFRAGDDISGREHTRFFVQDAKGEFEDVALDLALESLSDPYVTRGIAIADVDGDGDLDFVRANQWAPFVFYRNDSPSAGRALNLRVLRPITSAVTGDASEVRLPGLPAIGATVIVRTPDGRKLMSFVDGGNGHSGRRSPDVHIGLGNVSADAAIDTTIIWRDGAGRHEQHVTLTPGWHTVMLGTEAR